MEDEKIERMFKVLKESRADKVKILNKIGRTESEKVYKLYLVMEKSTEEELNGESNFEKIITE